MLTHAVDRKHLFLRVSPGSLPTPRAHYRHLVYAKHTKPGACTLLVVCSP